MNTSVLMCVYIGDTEVAFDRALSSILAQTRLPCELVLVADGPLTQAVEELIDSYHPRFREAAIAFCVYRLPHNCGHGVARQHGLTLCRGQYVIICDADDINIENRFERLINTFKYDRSLDVVGSNILEVDFYTLAPQGMRVVEQDHSSIVKDLAIRCPFNQMSVAFRKSAVLESGGYQDFYHNEDYSLWIRMYLNGCKFKNLNEVLVHARVNTKFYGRRGGFNYFLSEYKIQEILLSNKITSPMRFFYNVLVRFFVQVALPDSLRSIIFKKFARKIYKEKES